MSDKKIHSGNLAALETEERRELLMAWCCSDFANTKTPGPSWACAISDTVNSNVYKALYEARIDFINVLRDIIHDNAILENLRNQLPPR